VFPPRRLSRRDFDVFFFGTATSGGSVPEGGLVPLPVMQPSFSVASTKAEAALGRGAGS